MSNDLKKMRPIWFFVGMMLLAIGIIVMLSGVYSLFFPSNAHTVLAHLHPSLWWGFIIFLAGIIFLVSNKNVTVD